MNDVLSMLGKIGIVPVIAIEKASSAAALGRALCEGGLACAEVTFRTSAAEEAISIMSRELPEMIVGAGTVLTTEQVDRAVEAGAAFIVSPGFNPAIVGYCADKGIPIVPGCATPSDIERAMEFGLEVVKFFPAEAAGGIAMIKAMSAPYGRIKFMPTGGINSGNINNYLAFPKVLACGGSWMVDKSLINAGSFDEITRLTREAVTTILGYETAHVGINMEETVAEAVADRFEGLFGMTKKSGSGSVFAGSIIELMKSPHPGSNGHIAMKTNSIERAMYHLGRSGVEFDMESAVSDDRGRIREIYLKEELGGLSVRLVEK